MGRHSKSLSNCSPVLLTANQEHKNPHTVRREGLVDTATIERWFPSEVFAKNYLLSTGFHQSLSGHP